MTKDAGRDRKSLESSRRSGGARSPPCSVHMRGEYSGTNHAPPSWLMRGRLDHGELFRWPSLYGLQILTDPRLDPGLPTRMGLARLFCRRRALGGHGAGGYGLRRYCRCAPGHGALHNRASLTRLRVARHVASTRRRTGHRYWPDLGSNRRRCRNPGYCGV
jgi:hypothetical protein